MQSRTVRLVASTVAALTAAGLLAACSGGDSGGSTTPSSAPSSGSSGGDGVDPALKVPAPLPTGDLLNNPCAVLSASQLTTIGLKTEGVPDDRTPKACSWVSSTLAQNSVGIGALPQNAAGISDIYDGKSSAAYFTPTTVDGYPGVYTDKADLRSSGTCQLWVGVTDQLAVAVGTTIGVGSNKSNPCPIAEKVATAMIEHLKGAA
ncbi:DUF3558 domain-containing protein [Amycolatopsis sp. NPDC049253]|uniref:DUF3558 domain-containing protein n=1 Tax=Amycolatopsis sp. NPDC049253 TaxID=3155274 RepID=UPI00343F237C